MFITFDSYIEPGESNEVKYEFGKSKEFVKLTRLQLTCTYQIEKAYLNHHGLPAKKIIQQAL